MQLHFILMYMVQLLVLAYASNFSNLLPYKKSLTKHLKQCFMEEKKEESILYTKSKPNQSKKTLFLPDRSPPQKKKQTNKKPQQNKQKTNTKETHTTNNTKPTNHTNTLLTDLLVGFHQQQLGHHHNQKTQSIIQKFIQDTKRGKKEAFTQSNSSAPNYEANFPAYLLKKDMLPKKIIQTSLVAPNHLMAFLSLLPKLDAGIRAN